MPPAAPANPHNAHLTPQTHRRLPSADFSLSVVAEVKFTLTMLWGSFAGQRDRIGRDFVGPKFGPKGL